MPHPGAGKSGLGLLGRRRIQWSGFKKTATMRWTMMLDPLDTGFVYLQANCHMEELWHVWDLS
jgi:hypothetical protein